MNDIGVDTGESYEEAMQEQRDKVYKPVVIPHDHMPRLGQEIVLLDDVHEFYNEYAKKAGFSVRINFSRKSHTGKFVRKEYVCSKEGATTKEVVEKKRRRGKVREGCKSVGLTQFDPTAYIQYAEDS
ncbi:hypothetical protein CICLE_v10033450mg [Citrus x clementina]|uniref:FAR1 domain-containing protein n=1 Tax=Citrus clementina TaxID=85681 RepID=V4TNB0_CITCL|nr:hypothetical protein CICLE_v10033450mg [Citrus x clementina]